MDLLPKAHTEFGSSEYWEKFFKKRGDKAFEWYGEYSELCGILHKYVKPADKLLVIGCGNSSLSADLYNVGYHSITNIDISAVVIRQMKEKNAEQRPDMKWIQMDMLQMDFEDGAFSVVLDKGTLDAVMTDSSAEVLDKVDRMFSEIGRVLRVGGRYVCISLAQEHIVKKMLQYFINQGWMIRICRVTEQELLEKRDFHMPVFVYVLTKFKKMPNMKPILEVSQFEDKVDRYDSPEQLLGAVREMQQYGLIRHQLNKGSRVDDTISLDLYSSASNSPRYTLHVVDSHKKRAANKFAIFIVPEGRETEWLFCSNEGRLELCDNAGFERIVVVTLHRDQQYACLDDVKAELSTKVMELAPANLGSRQVPFLSIGDDIKQRTIKHCGRSDFSGEFVVEDVDCGDTIYRRLVFLANKNVVQSEAKLIHDSGRKKGGKRKSKIILDHNHLSVGYYSIMVAGFSLLDDFHRLMDSQIELLLVGLGGGSLPFFIHRNFPKVILDVVEIDNAMVTVARDWFGFQPDSRMCVHVDDGIRYIDQLAKQGNKRHVIILDVDSKDTTVGMSCPPQSFVDPAFLKFIDSILHPSGVFMLNLVSRSQTVKNAVLSDLKNVFKAVYSKKLKDDVNEVVFALPTSRPECLDLPADGALSRTLQNTLKQLQDSLGTHQVKTQKKDILKLTDKLQGLKLL